MRVYHFTSAERFPRILADGGLRKTESNVSMRIPHAGPDVVWLLDTPDLDGFDHGLGNARYDKTEIVIEAEVPDKFVRRWLDWAQAQAIEERWLTAMIFSGGGLEAAGHWLVSFKAIPIDWWVSVKNNHTGEIVLRVPSDQEV